MTTTNSGAPASTKQVLTAVGADVSQVGRIAVTHRAGLRAAHGLVQSVARKHRGRQEIVAHVGSADTDAELRILLEKARGVVDGAQGALVLDFAMREGSRTLVSLDFSMLQRLNTLGGRVIGLKTLSRISQDATGSPPPSTMARPSGRP